MKLRILLGVLGRAIRTLWLWLGLSLVLLLLVDALLDAALPDPAGLAVIDPAARAPARESADAFADRAWSRSYFAEFEQARHTAWRSYVYFRRLPFAGTHIQVDAHGFRVTPKPAVPAPQAPLTVWLFGGSLVWGTGVDDAHTLATALQQRLARLLERPVEVLNFGESGYVAQQSALAFAAALRCAGPPPDLALFVDGANDIYAALQSGRAGLPQNEANRVAEFNLSRRFDRVLLAWASRLKGVGKLIRRPLPEIDPAVLGPEVARSYLATIAQSQALATARGIPALFFWQPTLFTKVPLSPDETQALGASLVLHRDLQLAAEDALRVQASTLVLPLVDLSAVFAPQPQPRYFDFVHLNAAGLADLATTMAWHIPGVLDARATAPAPPAAATTATPRCPDRPLAASAAPSPTEANS